MRATFLIGTLVLMAACAEQPAYQDPAPTGASAGSGYAQTPPPPCKRSDYPYGAAGDTAYTNCIIES
ncbi:MAG: hypothetical protein KDK53_15110 [Maritimibacter sp.]|nr:hypothetical protein [Maritimibacter sp.]